MSRHIYDHTIVGAGIVGLATALELLKRQPGTRLAIIEKERAEAMHQTGRNSGVLHSGIYYTPGSLKALNCVKGYKMMVDFCKVHAIDHDICGKVIVAVDRSQFPILEKIYQNGLKNGLQGIRYISMDEMLEREPAIRGEKAILVPQTGIVDYNQVAAKMKELIIARGGEFLFGLKVRAIQRKTDTVEIKTKDLTIHTRFLITCAGLYSDKLAKMSGTELQCRIVPFRGEYFKFKEDSKHLVNHLVYPVPNPDFPFLGVHFTRMTNGNMEAGPNAVLAFAREGYTRFTINLRELMEILLFRGFRKLASKHLSMGWMEMKRSFSKRAFTKELQKLLPGVQMSDLEVAPAGVRAQALNKDGSLVDDFLLEGSGNILHVINAPSPAATAALSIAEHIADEIEAAKAR